MADGSYTSSSGPFNPASYTRHFLGSPISWRGGSFGAPASFGAQSTSFGARFPVGSPTAHLLNSIDPNDFKYGKTPSSVENGSILNALNVFDREGELCRNYTCCGLHLNDMHALLEHFEEVHIVVLDPTAPQPQAQIQIPFNPQVNELPNPSQSASQSHSPSTDAQPTPTPTSRHSPSHLSYFPPDQHQQYSTPFDPDDMELELDMDNHPHPPPSSCQSSSHSSPSSGAPSPPDTPISTPLSAYPSPHAFQNHLPQQHQLHLPLPNMHSPYISNPPSPLSSAYDSTAASTRQSSPTGGATRPNLNLNLASFPRSTINSPSILAHPEDAFNAYARFSSDYSSCLPGAQYNGAAVDEASAVHGVSPVAWQPAAGQAQGQCVPPALLFSSSNSATPASTPGGSRVPSPTGAYGNAQPHPLSQTQSMPTTPITSGHPSNPTNTSPTPSSRLTNNSASSAMPNSSSSNNPHPSTLSRPASSLLLSKPFKCPKPNCNKSYKQANGLKYHMTHGSCNFAPPKDLEHVKDLLERKRRDRELGLTRSASLSSVPGETPEKSYNYGELGNITETELREVEREAERRLRPFACGVGDCQRRYKNMNGLRYHYQHSGDHGAVGLALLANGQHECLQHGAKRQAALQAAQNHQSQLQYGEDREGRKRTLNGLGGGVGKGSVSVPVSRAGSTSRTGTPQPAAIPVTVHSGAGATTTPLHVTPVSAFSSTFTSSSSTFAPTNNTASSPTSANANVNGSAPAQQQQYTPQQQQQMYQYAQIQRQQYQQAMQAAQQQFADQQAAQQGGCIPQQQQQPAAVQAQQFVVEPVQQQQGQFVQPAQEQQVFAQPQEQFGDAQQQYSEVQAQAQYAALYARQQQQQQMFVGMDMS
ncbi:hypothetical protein BDQ12DRAFT_698628 [Crucibulum laeve]|uniref:C2H2-type domain-containing protein n=1 Tax=Crucibulum laeve TaxID=68775 RepID=A0A5C3LZX3_9AGAR|nr:hypothetical protein BDQ12DRAFT_698628 [Crucibulum laeve]